MTCSLTPMALACYEGPWDAAVIGAGPAGSMAARDLASAGARVLLVDRRSFPRDKVCGGCLNGQALAVLRSAGLGDLPWGVGGRALESFRLGVAGRSVQLALPAGVVVSRSRFDAELVATAVAAGATFLPGIEAGVGAIEGLFRTVRLRRSGDKRTVQARVVLLATGLRGRGLADDLTPRTRVSAGSRVGAACLIGRGVDRYEAGTIHMAVGKAGYVGLVVQDGGLLHVAAALDPGECRRPGGPGAAAADVLAEAGLPALDELTTASWRGTPGLTRRTQPLADERLFILGDAAGYVEPFTGEGIAWALASARAVVVPALDAIERWDVRLVGEWASRHARVVGRRQATCRAAAAVLRRPWLVRAACEVVSVLPGSARRLVEGLNAPPCFPEMS